MSSVAELFLCTGECRFILLLSTTADSNVPLCNVAVGDDASNDAASLSVLDTDFRMEDDRLLGFIVPFDPLLLSLSKTFEDSLLLEL